MKRLVVILGVLVGLFGSLAPVWALSVVNLNPGYPTQLDDAFPVKKGEFIVQSSVVTDIYQQVSGGREYSRLQTLHDLRYGWSDAIEFTIGANSLRGAGITASVEDRSAIRMSFLTRLFKPASEGLAPHVSVRFQGNVPIDGGTGYKASLISSWTVAHSWWVSGSVWHAVTELEGPMLWGPRRTLTGATIGGVHAVSPTLSLVVNGSYHQNHVWSSLGERYIFAPEVGLVWLFDRHWELTASVGRDLLGGPGNSILEGRLGLSLAF